MTAILDHGRLAALAGASGVTPAAMLEKFLRLNAADAALLRQAVQEDDFRRVGFLAHRMTGASLMLGAPRLALTCSDLSAASQAADGAVVRDALASLDREIAGLRGKLAAWGSGAGDGPTPE